MLIVSCEKGPGILECDEQKKGLLPRVVDGIFECIKSSEEATKYSVKLSMVMRIADLRLFSYWLSLSVMNILFLLSPYR